MREPKQFDFTTLRTGPVRDRINAALEEYSLRLEGSDQSFEYFLWRLGKEPRLVLKVAQTLRPKQDWFILKSSRHWVVSDAKRTLVFDSVGFENLTADESLNLARFGDVISDSLIKKMQELNIPSHLGS